MNPDPQNRRRTIIILVVVSALLVAALVFLFTRGTNNGSTGDTSGTIVTKYDANSGETVRTIEGESNTGTSGTQVYLGTNELLNRGLSSNQITNLQTAFYRYSALKNLGIRQVSISVKTIETSVTGQGANRVYVAKFGVVFDEKTTVRASLNYSGLNSVQLFLYDLSGALLYDSGVISAGGPYGD